MSGALRIQSFNREEPLPGINVSSQDILSCCVRDLFLHIKNYNENENGINKFTNNNNIIDSPTKIRISLEKNDNFEENANNNKPNEKLSKLSNISNEDKQIQFSILLPKHYRESKNCKIQFSMDMNICTDNNQINDISNLQSKNTIANSVSSVNSNNKISSNGLINKEKNSRTNVKRSIIDNLNSCEPLKTKRSHSSTLDSNSSKNSRLNSISNNRSNNNNNYRSNSISNNSRNNNTNSYGSNGILNNNIINSKNNSELNSTLNNDSSNSNNNIAFSNSGNKLNNVTSNSMNNSNEIISNNNYKMNSVTSNSVNNSNRSISDNNNRLNSVTLNSRNSSNNRLTVNNSSRRNSSASCNSSNITQNNNSKNLSRGSSTDKNERNSNSNSNSGSYRNSNSNFILKSFSLTDSSSYDRDEELMKIRLLKDDIDKVIEYGGQKRKNSSSSNNSSHKERSNQSSQSSVNTMQQIYDRKDSINSKPPLASSNKNSSNAINNSSNYDNNGKNEYLNDNDEDVLKNLYLPKDSNKIKSTQELEYNNDEDEDELYSPVDDKEYNYIIDLIENEYTVDENNEPINSSGSNELEESQDNDETVLRRDPSIVYNDDNKEKLERCYSSSYELSGAWKYFIIPYILEPETKINFNKDCTSRVYDDFTTEAKIKAYHHWVKVMLPEYSSFISHHSLQTVCAQNYIIAALIEKMSFFRMAEEDPNPIIRESPQYNIERLDICLQYIKNIMDLPIAVTPYDLHLGKLASVFSLLTQLIRYYKRGKEIKDSGNSRKEKSLNTIEEGEQEDDETNDNYKITMNSSNDKIRKISTSSYSDRNNFEQ